MIYHDFMRDKFIVYIFPSNYFQEKQVERWMRRPGYYNNFPHTSITRSTSNFSSTTAD